MPSSSNRGRSMDKTDKKSKQSSSSRSPVSKRSKSGKGKSNGHNADHKDRRRGKSKEKVRDKDKSRGARGRQSSRVRDVHDNQEQDEDEGEEIVVTNLQKGDRVECRHVGGRDYYPGKISSVSYDKRKGADLYNVLYDDGDREKGVKRLRLRLPGELQPTVLEAGTLCEARHQGGNECYDGVISNVHPDTGDGHTYDITYDDGDEETRVIRDYIFVVCVAGGDFDNDASEPRAAEAGGRIDSKQEQKNLKENQAEDEATTKAEADINEDGNGNKGISNAPRSLNVASEEQREGRAIVSTKSKSFAKTSQKITPVTHEIGGATDPSPFDSGVSPEEREVSNRSGRGSSSGRACRGERVKEEDGEMKDWGTTDFKKAANIDDSINILGEDLMNDQLSAALVQHEKQQTKKIYIPVVNLLMVKSLYSPKDSEAVHLLGTMVQQQIGIYLDKADFLFGYRFNDNEASEMQCSLRKRVHTKRPLPVTRATFSVDIPLKVQTELDQFPFRLVKASAMINLNSVVFPAEQNSGRPDIELMPNMLLSTLDERHNFAIKCSDHFEQEAVDDMTTRQRRKFLERVYSRDVDKIEHLMMLPMLPTYEVEWTKPTKGGNQKEQLKGRCEKLEVSFYLEEPAVSKFINVLFPMMLIFILTSINVMAGFTSLNKWDNFKFIRKQCEAIFDQERVIKFFEDDDNDEYDDSSLHEHTWDYLEIASGIALATILLLPQLLDVRSTHAKFTTNHLYIIWVFISLAMASVPPNFGVFKGSANYISLVPVLGAFILLLTFFYPLYNRFNYNRIRSQLLQVEPETKDTIVKHSKAALKRQHRNSIKLRRVSAAMSGSEGRSNSASLEQPFGGGLDAIKKVVGLNAKHRVRFIGKAQFKIEKHLKFLSQADPKTITKRVQSFVIKPEKENVKTGKHDDNGSDIILERERQHPIWRDQESDETAKFVRIGMGVKQGLAVMKSEKERREDQKVQWESQIRQLKRKNDVSMSSFTTSEGVLERADTAVEPSDSDAKGSFASYKSWMGGGALNAQPGAAIPHRNYTSENRPSALASTKGEVDSDPS